MDQWPGQWAREPARSPELELRRNTDAPTHVEIGDSGSSSSARDLERPSRRVHRGASAGGGGSALPAVQPLSAAARLRPAYCSPAGFAVGAIKGSTRSSNHLRSLFRRVASIDADADLF